MIIRRSGTTRNWCRGVSGRLWVRLHNKGTAVPRRTRNRSEVVIKPAESRNKFTEIARPLGRTALHKHVLVQPGASLEAHLRGRRVRRDRPVEVMPVRRSTNWLTDWPTGSRWRDLSAKEQRMGFDGQWDARVRTSGCAGGLYRILSFSTLRSTFAG